MNSFDEAHRLRAILAVRAALSRSLQSSPRVWSIEERAAILRAAALSTIPQPLTSAPDTDVMKGRG